MTDDLVAKAFSAEQEINDSGIYNSIYWDDLKISHDVKQFWYLGLKWDATDWITIQSLRLLVFL